MVKKHLYILFAILLFTACHKDEPKIPAPETTPQTTLMYMTGTDLAFYYGKNIYAAKSAISKNALGYGRFILFKHRTKTQGHLIEYKYKKGKCIIDTLKTYDPIISLSQEAIAEVIADTKEAAPADSYNLIVSGHATGWVPKSHTTSTWSVAAASTSDPIDWGAMATPYPIVTRYMGSDGDGYFNIEEFKESLEVADTHFDYIIFDQCFMSSIEALYTLRNLCDYIVASPCEIVGDGFPYDTVLPKLFSKSGLEFDLKGVCQSYLDYYTVNSLPSGCVAMAVTAELEHLAQITAQINKAHAGGAIDLSEIQAYERLKEHLFFDFEQYMLAKCSDEGLREDFLFQMELAFPSSHRLHTERFFAKIGVAASSANNYDEYFTPIEYYSGVTTSAPAEKFKDEWSATEWAKAVN